jgi:hypothetical protein
MRGHASTRGVPHLMEKTPKFRNIFFLGREVASMLLRKRFRNALESGVAEQEFLILDARFSKVTK